MTTTTTIRTGLFMAAALFGLSGCAHTFRPGPGMTTAMLRRIDAECHRASRQHDSSFSAQGRAGFVAAAAATSLVLDGIRTVSDYNDCMVENGAEVDDGKPVAPVQLAQPAPPLAPEPLAQPQPPYQAQAQIQQPVQVPEVRSPMLIASMPATFTGNAAPDPVASAISYRTFVAYQAIDTAGTWIRAQDILARGNRTSRDLYLVLCGGGDNSSCMMAADLSRR